MNNLTAIEKLIETIEFWNITIDCPNLFKAICDQALELEKEQHKQTYEAGKETYRQHLSYGEGLNHFDFYYQKTFKKIKQ